MHNIRAIADSILGASPCALSGYAHAQYEVVGIAFRLVLFNLAHRLVLLGYANTLCEVAYIALALLQLAHLVRGVALCCLAMRIHWMRWHA